MASGDVACVGAGTYAGFHMRGKHGSEGQWIVLRPASGDEGEVVIDSYLNGPSLWRAVEFSGSSYVEVTGFELTDTNPLYHSPDPQDYTQGIDHDGVKLNGAYGSYPDTAYIRITGNHIHTTGGNGILTGYRVHHSEIIDNYIHDIALSKRGYGIYIGGSDHLISGNVIRDSYGYAIHAYTDIDNSSRLVIESNVLCHNGRGDYGQGSSGGSDGYASGDGILVWDGEGTVIRNNVIFDNYRWGIRVRNNTDALIINNTSYHNQLQGIYTYDGFNATVTNNISFANQGLDGYPGETYLGSGSTQSHNLLGVDPQFVNPQAGDFHLTANSPAIDAGTSEDAPVTDFEGDPRTDGLPDIGADEVASSSESQLAALRTLSPLVIDGSLSEVVWASANSISFDNPPRSDNDVTVFALWDAAYLYFAYGVVDDYLAATNAQLWQDDGAEIFLDTLNNGSPSMDGDDYQVMCNINGLANLPGVTRATAVVNGGYTMEIAIAWTLVEVSPQAGQSLGLLLANNDRDEAGASSQFDWLGLIESGSYARPYLWGELALSGQEVGSPGGLFADGFESGNTSAWSGSVP